jgi:hypothetical protein
MRSGFTRDPSTLGRMNKINIIDRYHLLGILLILLHLPPWGVAARSAILENKGEKSLFWDYFIIRAK